MRLINTYSFRVLGHYIPAFLAALCLLFQPGLCLGQFRSFDCAGEKELAGSEARDLLRKVQERYSRVTSVEADFQQHSYLAALDLAEMSSGQVWFSKPGKMKWHYTDPDEQVFLVREKVLWFYQKEDNQVLIDDFEDVLISDLPVSFLMGIGDLNENFLLHKVCRKNEGLVLDLKPKSSNGAEPESLDEPLRGFKLLVDNYTFSPVGAEVVDVGGNITSIILSKRVFDQVLKSSLFEPKFPRGIDISDRRKHSQ
jgi:outer membrane lipoprotein carrier protein